VTYAVPYVAVGRCIQKRQLLQQKITDEQRQLAGKTAVCHTSDVKEHASSTCIADSDSLLLVDVDTGLYEPLALCNIEILPAVSKQTNIWFSITFDDNLIKP